MVIRLRLADRISVSCSSASCSDTAWPGFCAVEPFDYHPDGPTSAARAIGYLRAIEETLA